jgi:hypothetical protein
VGTILQNLRHPYFSLVQLMSSLSIGPMERNRKWILVPVANRGKGVGGQFLLTPVFLGNYSLRRIL